MKLCGVVVNLLVLFSIAFGQDVTDLKVDIIEQLMRIALSLEAKVEELDAKMVSLDNKISSQDETLQELDAKIVSLDETLQDQCCGSSLQGGSQLENIYQTFADIFEEEFEFKRQLLNTTCSRDQVESLHSLFTTDECLNESHNCSPDATCTDAIVGFHCTCNEGYSGDGVTCLDIDECLLGTYNCSALAQCINTEGGHQCVCSQGYNGDGLSCSDVDECQTDVHECHAHAQCHNQMGNYSCSCKEGFSGDGFSCEDLECSSPSQLMSDFGCVIPLNKTMNFDDAHAYCKENYNGRLIEGITKRTQIEELKQHFRDFFAKHGPWIGQKALSWLEGQQEISAVSSLWLDYKPDSFDECGAIYLRPSKPGLTGYECTSNQPFICQKGY